MDDLLATNCVAPLPQGISSLGQRLADVVITYFDSKVEAELASQVGWSLLLFEIGLKSNLKSLLKIGPQAPTGDW